MTVVVLEAWDRAMCLKDPRIQSAETVPPALQGYAHWTQKVGGCIFSFSLQNMWRIRKHYEPEIKAGQAVIETRGQYRFDAFRERYASFKRMTDRAVAIKEGRTAPELDDGYEYKCPPLGDYQDKASRLLAFVDRVPLFADCGCVSGCSIISWSKGGAGKKTTMTEFFRYYHSKHGKRSLEPKVRSFDGERVRLHTIRNVVESGVKETYTLTLSDGKKLRATPDHEIMTDAGWVPLGKLKVGTRVMVDELTKHQQKEPGEKSKKAKGGDARVAVGANHPYARKQSSHNGRSHSFLIELHRAIFEAAVNQVTTEEFISLTYSDPARCSSMYFMDPSIYAVHHKNGDHYDNRPENLEVLTKSDHRKHHASAYKGYAHFGHGSPKYVEVASVEYFGPEMTYDIICDDPHRNFVADGIVVHNCGKTWAALTAAERRLSTLSLSPGKILVCGKLMTLASGWMADCQKFTDLKPALLWLKGSKGRKQKLLDILNEPADIFITNHETVRVLEDELAEKRFEGVIVDESSILKSFTGARAGKGGAFGRALMNVAKHSKWRVVMSGTPAPNGPEDLFGQFFFLNPDGFLLEGSYGDFKRSFMDVIYFGNKTAAQEVQQPEDGEQEGNTKAKRVPCKWFVPRKKAEEISELIRPLSYRVKIRDHLHDLPPKTVSKRVIDLTAEQAGHYANMKEELVTVINDERISVSVKLAQLMKLRQITSGLLIDESEKVHLFKDNPKIEMLDQLLNEEIDASNKVVIFGQYQAEIQNLVSRYKDQGVVSVFGGNTSSTNIDNLQKFIEDPAIRLVVMHPKSAGHGVTLTMAHYMVFTSIDYSFESYYQSVGRIERASQKHPMFVYPILARGTIDEAMWSVLSSKEAGQAGLIDQDQINHSIISTFKEL